MRQIVNLGKQKLSSSISNEPGLGIVDAQAETGDRETLFGRGNRSIERTPRHSSDGFQETSVAVLRLRT